MEHPYYDYLSDFDVYEIFSMFRNGEPLFSNFINPDMYQKALREFQQYGKLMRFPSKYVYQWMGVIMENTAKLRATTEIAGHTSYNVTSEFVDYFFDDEEEWERWKEENGEEDDYAALHEYLDEAGFFGDWCLLPDGSDAWSDYGLDPLEKLIIEYNSNMSPEEVLVLINKCIDISHCRGDLSSMFIKGGSAVLYKISNNESKMRNKNRIHITESQIREAVRKCIKEHVSGLDWRKVQDVASHWGRGEWQSLSNQCAAVDTFNAQVGVRERTDKGFLQIKRSGNNIQLLDVSYDQGRNGIFRYGKAYMTNNGWELYATHEKVMSPEEFFEGDNRAINHYYRIIKAIDDYMETAYNPFADRNR